MLPDDISLREYGVAALAALQCKKQVRILAHI
jgi:hypothetical protein